jgi:hypothetical protein
MAGKISLRTGSGVRSVGPVRGSCFLDARRRRVPFLQLEGYGGRTDGRYVATGRYVCHTLDYVLGCGT